MFRLLNTVLKPLAALLEHLFQRRTFFIEFLAVVVIAIGLVYYLYTQTSLGNMRVNATSGGQRPADTVISDAYQNSKFYGPSQAKSRVITSLDDVKNNK